MLQLFWWNASGRHWKSHSFMDTTNNSEDVSTDAKCVPLSCKCYLSFTKVTTKITSFVTSIMTSHMLVISWTEFYNIYLYKFLFLYISIDKVLFVCIYTNSTVHFVQRKQITFKNMSPTHLWLPLASNHSHLLRVHLKWKEEKKKERNKIR